MLYGRLSGYKKVPLVLTNEILDGFSLALVNKRQIQ